jgi:hypothetical protein
MEVLKPEIGVQGQDNSGNQLKRTTHLPYCTVVTRLTVL